MEDESNEFENEWVKSGKFEASRWLVDCKSETDGAQFGADDARVWSLGARNETPPTSDCDRRTCGNTKTVMLDVATNDNIVNKKMWTN